MKAIEMNQSTADRFVRILLGGACLIVPSYIALPDPAVWALFLVGLYLMFSGLAGQCLIYKLFHIKTSK